MSTKRAAGKVLLCCSWLLLAGTSVLWVRSYRGGDVGVVFVGGAKPVGVFSWRGEILLAASNVSFGDERAWTLATARFSDAEAEQAAAALLAKPRKTSGGFGVCVSRGEPNAFGIKGAWFGAAGLPHWLILLASLILPLRQTRRAVVGWHRRRNGLCLACGYDLRHSPERCPECGTARTKNDGRMTNDNAPVPC